MSEKYRPNYRLRRPNDNSKRQKPEDLEPEIYESRKIYQSKERPDISRDRERQSRRYIRPEIKEYGVSKRKPEEGERCLVYCAGYCPGYWLMPCPPECWSVNTCPNECQWYSCVSECGTDCPSECGAFCNYHSCSPVCASN